jgi:hypothetical protein
MKPSGGLLTLGRTEKPVSLSLSFFLFEIFQLPVFLGKKYSKLVLLIHLRVYEIKCLDKKF